MSIVGFRSDVLSQHVVYLENRIKELTELVDLKNSEISHYRQCLEELGTTITESMCDLTAFDEGVPGRITVRRVRLRLDKDIAIPIHSKNVLKHIEAALNLRRIDHD